MDQQWQKPMAVRAESVMWCGIRAVDFAQRNGDVSGWTVGRSDRPDTELYDHSDIGAPLVNFSNHFSHSAML